MNQNDRQQAVIEYLEEKRRHYERRAREASDEGYTQLAESCEAIAGAIDSWLDELVGHSLRISEHERKEGENALARWNRTVKG